MKMGDFKASKFSMHIDGDLFDVYPDVASVVAPKEGKFIQDLFVHSS